MWQGICCRVGEHIPACSVCDCCACRWITRCFWNVANDALGERFIHLMNVAWNTTVQGFEGSLSCWFLREQGSSGVLVPRPLAMQSYSRIFPERVIITASILTPPAHCWLQGQMQGRRPQFLLSSPLCPRVADLEGLGLQVIMHRPRNDFISQLQIHGWFGLRALCWRAFLSVSSLVTCDMTLPWLGRFDFFQEIIYS